jgi:hypothetical protein
MSVCTNLCPDRPSRLAAYAGCVILRARFRAQRAHQYAIAIADPHNCCPLSQMSVCTNLAFDRSIPLAAYAGYVVLRAIADPPIFIALSQ